MGSEMCIRDSPRSIPQSHIRFILHLHLSHLHPYDDSLATSSRRRGSPYLAGPGHISSHYLLHSPARRQRPSQIIATSVRSTSPGAFSFLSGRDTRDLVSVAISASSSVLDLSLNPSILCSSLYSTTLGVLILSRRYPDLASVRIGCIDKFDPPPAANCHSKSPPSVPSTIRGI